MNSRWVEIALMDMATNFLLFIPLGFLMAVRLPRSAAETWWLALLVLIITIELAQALVLSRSGDITDVILNWAGAMTGSSLGRGLQWLGGLSKGKVQGADPPSPAPN
jgi:glycopeptide antibiotics resistance protein